MQGFSGILQVDGYAGYNRLLKRPERDVRLAYCWAHARRKILEVARDSAAPIAEDGLRLIRDLYRIETDIRRRCRDVRQEEMQACSTPGMAELEIWLTHNRTRVSTKSPIGDALKYIAKYWDGLCLFLADGSL